MPFPEAEQKSIEIHATSLVFVDGLTPDGADPLGYDSVFTETAVDSCDRTPPSRPPFKHFKSTKEYSGSAREAARKTTNCTSPTVTRNPQHNWANSGASWQRPEEARTRISHNKGKARANRKKPMKSWAGSRSLGVNSWTGSVSLMKPRKKRLGKLGRTLMLPSSQNERDMTRFRM